MSNATFRAQIEDYRSAEALTRRLLEREPNNERYQEHLGAACEKIGDAALDSGDEQTAEKMFHQSFQVYEKLLNRTPTNSMRQFLLAIAYERRGNLMLHRKEYRQAATAYEKMLDLVQQALEGDPANLHYQEGLAVCYERLHDSWAGLGETNTATDYMRKAQGVNQKLSREGL